jgi:hypothetical protein
MQETIGAANDTAASESIELAALREAVPGERGGRAPENPVDPVPEQAGVSSQDEVAPLG